MYILRWHRASYVLSVTILAQAILAQVETTKFSSRSPQVRCEFEQRHLPEPLCRHILHDSIRPTCRRKNALQPWMLFNSVGRPNDWPNHCRKIQCLDIHKLSDWLTEWLCASMIKPSGAMWSPCRRYALANAENRIYMCTSCAECHRPHILNALTSTLCSACGLECSFVFLLADKSGERRTNTKKTKKQKKP